MTVQELKALVTGRVATIKELTDKPRPVGGIYECDEGHTNLFFGFPVTAKDFIVDRQLEDFKQLIGNVYLLEITEEDGIQVKSFAIELDRALCNSQCC